MNALIDHLIASSQEREPLPAILRLDPAPQGLQLVTGVRGSGTPEFLDARAVQLWAAGVARANVLRFDFADARLDAARGRGLLTRVLDRFFAANPQARRETCHLLLDRLDLLEGWEPALAAAMDVYDLRVVATGEHAAWASAPFAAMRRPPQVAELAPLSLVESASAGEAGLRGGLDLGEYVKRGGLLPVCGEACPARRDAALQALARDAVALKAAVDPALRDVPLALRLAQLALASTGERFSVTQAVETLREQGVRTTRATLAAQLASMADLHLVYSVCDYEAADKPNPRAAATVYAGDHALAAAHAPTGALDPLALARTMVYLHLRRTNPFGGIYTYKVGATGSVDFAVGVPAAGAPRALFHVAKTPAGPELRRALALLDLAMERSGLVTAALIHLGDRHTAHRTPHGAVRCVPLATWLLGE